MRYIMMILTLTIIGGCASAEKSKSDVADTVPATKKVRITLIRIDNLTIKAF